MGDKLNHLLKTWPPGTVATQSWLAEQGISPQLAHSYRKNRWLERLGHGAYVRSGDKVGWKGMVYSLQHHARLAVWPGGMSALALQGYAHYLPMGRERVWLFAESGTRLPAWVGQADWGVELEFHHPRLFEQKRLPTGSHQPWTAGGDPPRALQITVSSPERALLELLWTVKDTADFRFASETSASLVNLRPAAMQAHLEACRSIKVKRLALFLGAYHGHAWYAKLGRPRIDLGSGKRQIARAGVLNKEFGITVPPEFADGPE